MVVFINEIYVIAGISYVCHETEIKLFEKLLSLCSISEFNIKKILYNRDGRPSVRMVLMKSFDKNGITFCTNYESRKAKELVSIALYTVTFFR